MLRIGNHAVLPHIFLQLGLSDISPNQLVVGTTLAPEPIRKERIARSARNCGELARPYGTLAWPIALHSYDPDKQLFVDTANRSASADTFTTRGTRRFYA